MLDLIVGVFVGGLAVSAVWGLFWLCIGLVGLSRRTCSWRVVANSLAVGGIPVLLILGIMVWSGDAAGRMPAFAVGLLVMPAILTGLGVRRAADGQRAGAHMLAGVRHLRDELLGKHEGCGGCAHEHDREGCA